MASEPGQLQGLLSACCVKLSWSWAEGVARVQARSEQLAEEQAELTAWKHDLKQRERELSRQATEQATTAANTQVCPSDAAKPSIHLSQIAPSPLHPARTLCPAFATSPHMPTHPAAYVS